MSIFNAVLLSLMLNAIHVIRELKRGLRGLGQPNREYQGPLRAIGEPVWKQYDF